VQTARLILSPPGAGDEEALWRLYADEEVAAWLWPGDLGGPRSPEQAAEMLGRFRAHWDRYGFGPWIARDRQDEDVVGVVGLRHTVVGGRPEIELLWAIRSDRWGRGLATEGAAAAVRAAFEELEVDDVVAFTLHDNAASRAVMRKLGMAYERDVEHAGLPHVLYRLRRPRSA